MERRVVLAVILAIGVLFLTPRLFQRPRVPVQPPIPGDSAAATQPTNIPRLETPIAERAAPEAATRADTQRVRADTNIIHSSDASYVFESTGGVLQEVVLPNSKALNASTSPVRVDSRWDPLLSYSLVVPNDTISFAGDAFTTVVDTAGRAVSYSAMRDGWHLSVRYRVDTAGYLMHVGGEVKDSTGRPAGDNVLVVIGLPRALESFEANPVEDRRGFTVAFKPAARGASQIGVRSLDPNERRIEPGPLTWLALKSKYFIHALIATDSSAAFAELQVTGLPQPERDYPVAQISVIERLRNGTFGFDVYTGPQEWDAMVAVGRDFVSANSYGGWLQPIVQPFATIVMRVLLWMHRALNLHYGWVLLLFGVLVRLAMWPLNQVAMKSSMRMQELQPLLAEVQKRYKSDPQRMSAETMRLYKEHGMSPFSPLAGCFPILLSMPVLFALFFVFQSTIEFRGVPFLWLNDISIKDSLYIAPLLMGASMFFTSWLSMRSLPPNPQTRVMTYVLPVMMTVLLAGMASGLNLYWAAQNVASIPQQWLISRERERAKARKAARRS